MGEHCPLAGGKWPLNIPEICRTQCEALWEEAVHDNDQRGDYDLYKLPEDFGDDYIGCRHDDTDLQYSSDGLQAVDNSPLRVYSVVDECIECSEEVGEQSYQFQCPNN